MNLEGPRDRWKPNQKQQRSLESALSHLGFRGESSYFHSSVGKETACNAGDMDLIPGSGRSPGAGNGNPFQYPCLENPMDRGAWRATVHGITRSWTRFETNMQSLTGRVTEKVSSFNKYTIYRIIIYLYEWSCRILAPCGSLRNRLNYSEKELQNIEK